MHAQLKLKMSVEDSLRCEWNRADRVSMCDAPFSEGDGRLEPHTSKCGRAAPLIVFHICWEVSARLSSASLTPSIFTGHVTAGQCDPAGQHMEAIPAPSTTDQPVFCEPV